MEGDQRSREGSMKNRKHWTVRYLSLIIFLLGLALTTAASWADNKYATIRANEKADEALQKLKDRAPLVNQIPHVKDSLNKHVDDFKDFRGEQRTVNTNLNEKLDYLIRSSKGI